MDRESRDTARSRKIAREQIKQQLQNPYYTRITKTDPKRRKKRVQVQRKNENIGNIEMARKLLRWFPSPPPYIATEKRKHTAKTQNAQKNDDENPGNKEPPHITNAKRQDPEIL